MAKKVVRYKLVRHKWPDEIQEEKKRRKNKVALIVVCVIFFGAGFGASSLWNVLQSPSAGNEEFAKLFEIYNVMNTAFYFGKDKEDFSKALIEGAINGLVDAGGDQHTRYLDNDQTQSFTSSMEGSFVGIGVQYYKTEDGSFLIDLVYKGSPAEEAGLVKGDQIYAVEGKEVKGLTTDEVATKIKGNENTKVSIEIIRENKHLKKEVERREVKTSVYSEIKDDTAVLELNTFAETSGEEFGEHLKDIKAKGCKNLVLDFRDNGGGYLMAAQQIASYLLPEDAVIFKEKERSGEVKDYKTIEGYTKYTFDKIVILVNGDTASATEVLTAALKDYVDATIVGEKTYGKGTVQVPVPFKDGSMFKYTTAEWLTSKEASINGKGIEPDMKVSLDVALTTPAPELDDDELFGVDTVSGAALSTQTYLKFLGYSVDRSDAYFSTAGEAALKQYQKDVDLPVTGKINNKVINSLISSCSLKWHQEEAKLDLQMQKAMAIVNGK